MKAVKDGPLGRAESATSGLSSASEQVNGEPSDLPAEPLVSVVIGTRNSGKFLRSSLESIASQTYRRIEIVVIDNFSTDATVSIAREFTENVHILGPERSAQYNFGFRVAKGGLIYRAESDCVLEPTLIESGVAEIQRGYDAILVPNRVDASVSFWARVRALEQLCYADDDLNVAARLFTTPALRALGGYDETLVAAEDYDLHNRLIRAGYRVGRIQVAQTHLDEPRTLREVYRKHYYYGASIAKFLASNPGRGIQQMLPVRRAYLRHWRDFLVNPDLAVGLMAYTCVKYAGAWRGWSAAPRERGERHLISLPPDGGGTTDHGRRE